MILSKSCEYAIQAMLYLVSHKNEIVGLKEIAEDLEIPQYFLSKIMQVLVKRGLISSIKGPNGGFRIKMAPDQISLLAIVDIIDGLSAFDRCGIGMKLCDDAYPCPIHEKFKPFRDDIRKFLEKQTVALLAKKLTDKNSKITILPQKTKK